MSHHWLRDRGSLMSKLTIIKILSAHAWGDSLLMGGKASKDVFSGKNGQKSTRSSTYELPVGKNRVNQAHENTQITYPSAQELADELAKKYKNDEIKRAQHNEKVKGYVALILRQPEIYSDMKETFLSSEGAKYGLDKLAIGVAAFSTEFNLGASIVMDDLYKSAADSHEDLSGKFLRHVKPLFEEAGIIKNRDAKNFRWATLEELKAIIEAIKEGRKEKLLRTSVNKRDVKAGTLKSCLTYLPKSRVVKKSTDAYKNWAINKANKDEYSIVNEDGSVEKISKPLKGDLNHREKKIKRDYADAKATYDLVMKTANLKDKAFQKEMMKKEQELERMKYDMRREADLRMQQQRIDRAETLDGAKPFFIVGLGLAAYLFMQSDSGEPMPAFQPQNSTYVESQAEVSNENYVMEGEK